MLGEETQLAVSEPSGSLGFFSSFLDWFRASSTKPTSLRLLAGDSPDRLAPNLVKFPRQRNPLEVFDL